MVLLADAEDSGNSDVVHSEDPDGEDAVAAETFSLSHQGKTFVHHRAACSAIQEKNLNVCVELRTVTV